MGNLQVAVVRIGLRHQTPEFPVIENLPLLPHVGLRCLVRDLPDRCATPVLALGLTLRLKAISPQCAAGRR